MDPNPRPAFPIFSDRLPSKSDDCASLRNRPVASSSAGSRSSAVAARRRPGPRARREAKDQITEAIAQHSKRMTVLAERLRRQESQSRTSNK
jgi:hypothetical protein